MAEELNLVKDLAVILIAAGFFTILFKALKQPLILGYIVAGFVVGPHLGLFHLTSTEAVSQWSEIGIIFLLGGFGLEGELVLQRRTIMDIDRVFENVDLR